MVKYFCIRIVIFLSAERFKMKLLNKFIEPVNCVRRHKI